ncbi:GumC family protein [Pseudooceanicola nanhaiensis]|uniref:GumC family protein n=1 Tax=Pseudooceanicola nanhaiensis TaxID=375761 RepID=UPI0035194832
MAMTSGMSDAFGRGILSIPSRGAARGDSDGVDLGDLGRGVWRGRFVILAVALACGLIAALAVNQVTPRYSSVSQVLLESRERRYMTDEQVVSDLKLNDQVVASEISIMRSNVLLETVIQSLDESHPGLIDAIDPAKQEPGAIDRAKSVIKSVLSLGGSDGETVDEVSRRARLERLTWAIRNNVEIWRDGDAYIISISAKTVKPELSAALAGTIAEQYIALQLQGRQQTAAQATEWIEKRVNELRAQVEIAEDKVEDYRARMLVSHGTSLDIISQRMVTLNDELVKARIARVTAEARHQEITRLMETGGYEALGSMLGSDTITELLQRRVDILANDAQWAESFGEDHPERQKLARQLAEVDRALSVEFQRAADAQRNEVEIARVSEQTLGKDLDDIEEKYLSISRGSIGLRELEREAEAARNMYKDLLNRYAETRTQEQFQAADARIVERATVPGSPSSPRPKLMIFLGLMVGGTLGLGYVLYQVLARPTYRNLADLEAETGMPVLSVVPARDWGCTADALAEVEAKPLGPVAEAVRKLRNELSLGSEDTEPLSVALMSALPGEGKTTTTLLLARLAEMADKLVIVVDCDMRQNSIQKEYRWTMEHDFGDLIRGECDLLDAVYTETGRGFDVLAARERLPDAADLLSSDWLRGVLDELKDYYDVILVNCPAMLPAADALAVARAVDQRVMLVRHDDTPRPAVKRALSMLENNGLDTHGNVLTQVDPDTVPQAYLYEYGYDLRDA